MKITSLFANTDALLLFLLFLMPGFISLKIYDMLVPREERDLTNGLVNLIGYSTLNFIALFWLIILLTKTESVWLQWLYLFLLVLFFPALWPLLFKWWFSSKWCDKLWGKIPSSLLPRDPISTSWDWLFSQRRKFWVIVHLKNGEKVAGVLDNRSYTSSYPAPNQIYLGEEWILDESGEFKELRPNGVLIVDDILKVQVFEPEEEEDHEREESTQ